jgi:hypothetical protein
VRLIGDEDTSFALNVVSYQFPEADEYWDANWLVIRVEVRSHEGEWSATGAVLLTGEAAKLADWLEAPIGELEFLEPDLVFEAIEGRLRVWFQLGLRPDWAERQWVGERDLYVDLTVSAEELSAAAAELRQQLSEYPPRLTRP